MDIWSGGATQDYSLLRVFGCPAYFNVKDDKLNREQKILCFECQEEYKRLQIMAPEK